MLNWFTPARHSESARSGVSIAPCVMSVMYLTRMARATDATRSSRSDLSSGSPPVNVTSMGLKKRAASAKLAASVARVAGSVFQ